MPDNKGKETGKRKVVEGVYKVGDLYYCAKCDTLLKFGEICPNCLTEVDWDKIRLSFLM